MTVIFCSARSLPLCQWRQEPGFKGTFLLQGPLVKLYIRWFHFEHWSNAGWTTGAIRVITATTETKFDNKWGSSGNPVPDKGVWGNDWHTFQLPIKQWRSNRSKECLFAGKNEPVTNSKQLFQSLAEYMKQRLLVCQSSHTSSAQSSDSVSVSATEYSYLVDCVKVLYWPDAVDVRFGENEISQLSARFGINIRPAVTAFRSFVETWGAVIEDDLKPLFAAIAAIPVSTAECGIPASILNHELWVPPVRTQLTELSYSTLKSLKILSGIPSLVRSSHNVGRLRESNAERKWTNAAKVGRPKSYLRCAMLHKVAMRSHVERPGVNPLCWGRLCDNNVGLILARMICANTLQCKTSKQCKTS